MDWRKHSAVRFVKKKKKKKRESAGADSSIKLRVIVHFICVRVPRAVSWADTCNPEKMRAQWEGMQLQTGPRSESKISVGTGIIPACRHGSVELFFLSADRPGASARRARCLFESPGLAVGNNWASFLSQDSPVRLLTIYCNVHFSLALWLLLIGWLWNKSEAGLAQTVPELATVPTRPEMHGTERTWTRAKHPVFMYD